jgi:hypothetical protein
LPIVFFQQIGLVIWNWSNFRPIATRFEDEVMVGNTLFGWTSHATSLHEALDEKADTAAAAMSFSFVIGFPLFVSP